MTVIDPSQAPFPPGDALVATDVADPAATHVAVPVGQLAGAVATVSAPAATRIRAGADRKIRLERRTQPLERIAPRLRLTPVSMDLTPFLDGPEHLDDIVARVLAHGGAGVSIGDAGPGSLHTGHEAGLHYDVLTRSAVAEVVPELIFLHDNAATACLRAVTQDDDLVPLPGERGININITRNQDVHEWHVGGPDLAYTSSTGLQVPTVGAGLPGSWRDRVEGYWFPEGSGRDATPQRGGNGYFEVSSETPGAFVFHDGVEKHATLIERGRCLVAPGLMPHGVNAVPPGFTRITLIMSWCWREDLESAEAGYGRNEEKELADYLYSDKGHTGELKADERPAAASGGKAGEPPAVKSPTSGKAGPRSSGGGAVG